jgi:hypothetical protein
MTGVQHNAILNCYTYENMSILRTTNHLKT